MTLVQKINALLTAANTKTSAGDTNLTEAVQTLIDGYGVNVSGSGGNIGTATATPTTNATTVTFTGLRGSPTWFMFLPNNNVPAQTTTHRVITHTYDGTKDVGFSIYTTSPYGGTYNAYRNATNFSHTYSNGSLTLNSGGASYGGYYYNTASTLIYGY